MKNILEIHNIILKKNKDRFLGYVYFNIIIVMVMKNNQKKRIRKFSQKILKYYKNKLEIF